jgi:prenyltransferase beta subunit
MAAVFAATSSADEPGAVTVDASSVATYVRSCQKPNGAFGPADQEYTDAAWNYPAVQTLLLMMEPVPRPDSVLEHGLGFPRGHVGCGHWQFFHLHRLRQLLGAPQIPEPKRVTLEHQGFEVRYYGSPFATEGDELFKAGGRPDPDPRDREARTLGYYNLSSLYYLLAGMEASGRTPANPDVLIEFLRARQAPDGGFVDVRTADGAPRAEDAHVAHTFHAVAALKLLGAQPRDTARCADFIRGCQLPSGAFFHRHPHTAGPPANADIYYTWTALNALRFLGSEVPRAGECQKWIHSLQNDDGGFGDQPGWRSRLYSTYYAVDSLQLLTGDARGGIAAKSVPRRKPEVIPDGEFRIYQGLHKVPVLAPDDLEGLRQRGFHLLALKSGKFEDASRLRAAIRERSLPMDVVLCPEAYPHRVRRWGDTVIDHVGNFTLDPRWDESQHASWQAADLAGRGGLPWDEYRRRVVGTARRLGGLVYPEQDFEMEYAYSAYDEGVHGAESYNAILAGFNWAPRDFIRVFPWRERYVDKLTPVADADAHGDLKRWSPQLDHTRHLFLAKGPTYADFMEAAAARRVVCVIVHPEGVASGVTFYGAPAAVEHVRKRIEEWRWWGDTAPAAGDRR